MFSQESGNESTDYINVGRWVQIVGNESVRISLWGSFFAEIGYEATYTQPKGIERDIARTRYPRITKEGDN